MDLKLNKVIKALLLLTAFLFASCYSGPENLSTDKEEIIKYYESGKFENELNNVVDKTEGEFKDFNIAANDAVVFDIDETALSNYEFNKECDFGYIGSLWDNWIEQAKAPPMKGIKKLYDFFISKDLKIIFITGRKEDQYNSTLQNLSFAGYTKYDTLIVRKPNENKLTALEYKSEKRIELTKKGYHIVCDVGDQYSDLEGPEHGLQVKIPNYMYIIN